MPKGEQRIRSFGQLPSVQEQFEPVTPSSYAMQAHTFKKETDGDADATESYIGTVDDFSVFVGKDIFAKFESPHFLYGRNKQKKDGEVKNYQLLQ